MAFSTTSYLAGVGSVVVILSTGFAGGYMLASPSHPEPPNRLQRLAAEGRDAKPAAAPAAKPEVVAAASSTPDSATPQPAAAMPPAQPIPAPSAAKAPEPVRSAAVAVEKPTREKANPEKANAEKAVTDKTRQADTKGAERKRGEARRVAERQRKQRELEVATVAVRQLMRDRYQDSDEFAAMDRPEPPPGMPRLMFGE